MLSHEEYTALKDAVRYEPRDAAIIEVLLQCGLRLSEVARIKLADVVLPNREQLRRGEVGSIQVYGKGRKTRSVTLNQKACKAVASYLAVRSRGSTDPHLFLTKYGRGIGSRSVHNVVAKYLGPPDFRYVRLPPDLPT